MSEPKSWSTIFFEYGNYVIKELELLEILKTATQEDLEREYHLQIERGLFNGTPLHLAIINSDKIVIEFLLNSVNVNAICYTYFRSDSVVFKAIKTGKFEFFPTTALNLAIDNGDINLIPILLAHGADSNVQFSEMKITPFHWFCILNDSEPDNSDDILDFNNILDSFAIHGARADIDDIEGNTAVISVQKRGSVRLSNFLLHEKLKYHK